MILTNMSSCHSFQTGGSNEIPCFVIGTVNDAGVLRRVCDSFEHSFVVDVLQNVVRLVMILDKFTWIV